MKSAAVRTYCDAMAAELFAMALRARGAGRRSELLGLACLLAGPVSASNAKRTLRRRVALGEHRSPNRSQTGRPREDP